MSRSYIPETIWQKYKTLMIVTAVVVLLLLLWLLWPKTVETEFVSPILQMLPAEIQKSGKFFPLPYEGKLLSGRPKEPMPIPKSVYEEVELTIDGKQVKKSPIVFPAGTTIQVKGVIWGQPELPRNIDIGGGLGIVQNAKNKRGWIVHREGYLHSNTTTVPRGSNTSANRCTFEVKNYKLPEEPGEYLLVVLSCARLGMVDHPELIAAAYDLVIE